MKDFAGKIAVVTGGASGVGRSLCFALARAGASVVVADIEERKMIAVVDELRSAGFEAIGQRADVTSQSSMDELANKAFTHYGHVDLVFANAGVGTGEGGPMWEYQQNEWEWGLRVNVWGLINTINAFVGRLVRQGTEAHFVVTGSGNGAFIMLPNTPIYTTTKAAVQAITENLYFQLLSMQSTVKVNALFPGPHVVNTGIFNSERNRPADLPADPNKPDSGIHCVDDMKAIMAQYGMTLQTTEPDEVAEFALEGLRADQFWITKMTDKSATALKQRIDGILTTTNPMIPDVL